MTRIITVGVSIYNTGFYIITKVYNLPSKIPAEINTTTRNTPVKVAGYIDSFLINQGISLDSPKILWKGYLKVVKDNNGFFKTKL